MLVVIDKRLNLDQGAAEMTRWLRYRCIIQRCHIIVDRSSVITRLYPDCPPGRLIKTTVFLPTITGPRKCRRKKFVPKPAIGCTFGIVLSKSNNEVHNMSTPVTAFAAPAANSPFENFSFELPDIGAEEVDIKVEYCGICHSDLSMWQDAWGRAQFPLVAGHEVVGTVVRAGPAVHGVKVGDRVGLGWLSDSCLHCNPCLSGQHNLCNSLQHTIMGRHGGFADTVRCHWVWATPIPDGLDVSKVGPLLCAGITVYYPLVQLGIKPSDKVAVIGIGGLGHLALQFFNKWGCEVTAFSSSPDKAEECRQLGAHHVVNSRSAEEMAALTGKFDLILNTVDVTLDWQAYADALAPTGKLHTVGAVPEPFAVRPAALINGEKSVSGSVLGSPRVLRDMLDFAARHGIEAITEEFAAADINAAFERLESGKARYRVVLKF